MVKAMDCGIVVREFVLQSRYNVHFQANNVGKGKNPLILQDTNCTATCLLSRKLFKLDEPGMQDTAGEAGTNS